MSMSRTILQVLEIGIERSSPPFKFSIGCSTIRRLPHAVKIRVQRFTSSFPFHTVQIGVQWRSPSVNFTSWVYIAKWLFRAVRRQLGVLTVTTAFLATPFHFRNHQIHKISGSVRSNTVSKGDKDNEGPNSCHENCKEKNNGKLLKKGDCCENHYDSRTNSCKGRGQNGRSHSYQGVLGSITSNDVAIESAVGMSKMNDKITTNANGNSETDGLEATWFEKKGLWATSSLVLPYKDIATRFTYNPRVQPAATSIDVTEVRMKAIVNTAKSVRMTEREEKRITSAAADKAMAAAP